MCFHICTGSSKNKFYQICHGYNCHFSKNAKHIYLLPSFPIFKMHSKLFQIWTSRLWWASTFHKLSIYTLFIFFLKYIIAPIIWNTNCSIIGIILPLIKMQIKPFQNSKQMLWLDAMLNKLSSNINFTDRKSVV